MLLHPESVSVALANQQATHMPLIIFSFVACLVLSYFSTSHEGHDFREKNIYILKIKLCF